MTYSWKIEMAVSPDVVGEEIAKLDEESGGMVTPQLVVDAAVEPDSVMHPLFTWDDVEAAAKQRRGEASYVLRNLMVVVTDEGSKSGGAGVMIPVRALVNARTAQGRGYMSIAAGLSNPVVRRQVLEEALRGLKAWKKKYEALTELAAIFQAIDEVDESLDLDLAA